MQAHHPKWLHRTASAAAVFVGFTWFVACTDFNPPPTAPALTSVSTTASVSADSDLPQALEKAKSKPKQDSVPGTISAPVMRSPSAGSMELNAVRRMLEEWTKRRSGTRFKVDFSLTLKALDAMAAGTPEDRRRILAELPIRLEKTIVGTDSAGRQIIRTRVMVRGVQKSTYDRVVATRTDNTTPDLDAIGQPLEDGESLGENPIPVLAECPEDPEDCMTEPEAEDAGN